MDKGHTFIEGEHTQIMNMLRKDTKEINKSILQVLLLVFVHKLF